MSLRFKGPCCVAFAIALPTAPSSYLHQQQKSADISTRIVRSLSCYVTTAVTTFTWSLPYHSQACAVSKDVNPASIAVCTATSVSRDKPAVPNDIAGKLNPLRRRNPPRLVGTGPESVVGVRNRRFTKIRISCGMTCGRKDTITAEWDRAKSLLFLFFQVSL